jgi:hypothetical protein
MINFSNRPAKEAARKYLFETTERQARRSLWLPSWQCLDIKLAFEMGILDSDSEIIAVEQERDVFDGMQRTLRSIAKKQGLKHAPIALHSRLEDVTLTAPIDFAFIDLCGTCGPPILLWMESMLAPNLMEAADVAVTFTYTTRRTTYFHACRDVLLEHWRDLYVKFVYSHDCWIPSKHPYEPILLPVILLKCALHKHDVLIRQPFAYRDGYPMLGVKVSDICTPGQGIYPPFSTLHAMVPANA